MSKKNENRVASDTEEKELQIEFGRIAEKALFGFGGEAKCREINMRQWSRVKAGIQNEETATTITTALSHLGAKNMREYLDANLEKLRDSELSKNKPHIYF